ncbi:MAG: deoxyribonuclease IV, partial [Synergistaceae bacterium]
MALIGAHISTAGGLCRAFERADALGCESMQIFTRNQRQWLCKDLSFSEIEAFYRASQTSGVKSVVSHASYLINLAGEPIVREKSEAALLSEVKRCHALSIPNIVLHPGFSGTGDAGSALKLIADSLLRVFDCTADMNVSVLLETMAGQGTVIGGDFSHFSSLLDLMSDHPRVGLCADMCHIFAAGYEIRSYESYDKVVSLLFKHVGQGRIK